MGSVQCELKNQGVDPGSCPVEVDDHHEPACRTTLKEDQNGLHRLISAVHLSRPENYLSGKLLNKHVPPEDR